MRSYRDAKLLAQALRHALLDRKNVYLGRGESLELVSNMFGLRDWNTLSARIKAPGSDDGDNRHGFREEADDERRISHDKRQYTGFYKHESGILANICLEDNILTGQLTGQMPVVFEYEGNDTFYSARYGARLLFCKNADGRVTGHICQQGGEEIEWKRVTRLEAEETEAGLKHRIQKNEPAPNTEAMLRKLINGLLEGNPDYNIMSAMQARAIREQYDFLHQCLASAGDVLSVSFIGVQDDGCDAYHVKHDKRLFRWTLCLDPGGKKIVLSWCYPGG